MKKFMIAVAILIGLLTASNAFAEIKYINDYSRSDGTYVSGHFRDTSNDGNKYNNANYLGYNN
jgi:hypothetical protein